MQLAEVFTWKWKNEVQGEHNHLLHLNSALILSHLVIMHIYEAGKVDITTHTL